jgi:methanogenic corrinoid protein MtbC1
MNEATLRALATKIADMADKIEATRNRLADVEDLRQDMIFLVEKEAFKLGIDPYEVLEF